MYMVEEFFYAAFEIKQIEWARVFLKLISSNFPQSVKSMRLLATFHEAASDHDKAREIYNELLSLNANDTQTIKRLVALDRDRGRLNEAIELLNRYLEANQQDTEAWLELTEIYLSRQNFEKAQFCYEEILSTAPNNFMVNIKYAEILYSTANGGENLDNLYLARKYFSHALAIQGSQQEKSQPRALWGLLQTCKAIAAQSKKEDEKNSEIIRTCQEKLKEMYQRSKVGSTININGMKLMN